MHNKQKNFCRFSPSKSASTYT